ncbi:MAG: hypothetical protein COU40_01385 [Candidatus Moranbacteria bacterium CG10_big_fil_rev_8_21_14_0_10_35_21]|nr:MAG: hypothetical protein COU40_01385 [Candidatus Moranbacteria bacterium CG10_big_fil_rev_8_21_14_0_10_35_21]PJA88987.1 MAG: hypothetical protein CO139_00210 [Candidatus Moranbacteria bacterium CG_4_9_14_3_um_filter_36_9]
MRNRKIVLILFKPTKKISLNTQYNDFYAYAEKKDILLCRAPIDAYNLKDKNFRQAQFFHNKKWLWKKDITPDLIYDKSPFYLPEKLAKIRKIISSHYLFINNLAFSKLLSDKWLTYKKLPAFSPKTILIEKKSDLKKIQTLSSEKIILKPLWGSGGKGIFICLKNKPKELRPPFIAQELIEVKRGLKGFVSGVHDLRIMIMGKTPFYSYLRLPKKNHLISNLSQGGKIKVIPITKLPKFIFPFLNKIQKKLTSYGKNLYSVDLIIDDDKKPWIIELNSRPGLILEKEELPFREYFYDNLINFFNKTI